MGMTVCVLTALTPGLQHLLPLKEFVRETQMGLDDDVEAAGADETIRPRERQVKGAHHLRDADCRTSGYADAAVD